MRNRDPITPINKKKDVIMSSGKKLVQARLSFKTIAPGSTTPSSTDKKIDQPSSKEESGTKENFRKRKLSYELEDDGRIVTDSSSHSNGDNSKENEVLVTRIKKPATEIISEIMVIDDDTDDENDTKNERTPQTKHTRKDTRTPSSSSKSVEKGSACEKFKVQIKLPLISNKRTRRGKKSLKAASPNANETPQSATVAESSDEVEYVGFEVKPQKRAKVEDSLEDSNEEKKNEEQEDGTVFREMERIEDEAEGNSNKSAIKEEESAGEISVAIEDISDSTKEEDYLKTRTARLNPQLWNVLESADVEIESKLSDDSKVNESADTNGKIVGVQKKILTPKQLKLHEQRRKAREEKEKRLQEERKQKQLEKEIKENTRKQDREEKEKQRRKEREVREEIRRQEREEKERLRLAEIEAKNEEKRKRTEAKEEELRRKDEERKRKEQEKEEAEMKKKKAAETFTKFFVAKTNATPIVLDSDPSRDGGETDVETLAFRPFQIKGDMKMAPVTRMVLSQKAHIKLDECIHSYLNAAVPPSLPSRSELYLSKLAEGQLNPCKWKKPIPDGKGNDDVIIVEDGLELPGQAIVEEVHGSIEHYRAKFYMFTENRRPPYFGTWRKTTKVITPRRPFAQDKEHFDYEVDSDDEWEEEEPGESLNGSDDDKEKESEDDDYEVDNEWFVPHGHLSEEELQNGDDCNVGDENTREAQKAKLQFLQREFAQEMKKKTEKIQPRLLGCIWADENGNQPEMCPKAIWNKLNASAMLHAAPPLIEEPDMPENSEPNSPIIEKLKPVTLSEKMLKDLVRLIHGNGKSKVFLIKEFIAYVEANDESIKNGDARGPLKSVVREKIDEFADWQITETLTETRRKKTKKRLCWIVSEDVLKNMGIEDLSLDNTWEYILQPKTDQSKDDSIIETETATDEKNKDANSTAGKSKETNNFAGGGDGGGSGQSKGNLEITKFAKILTAEEKAEQLREATKQNSPAPNKITDKTKLEAKTPDTTIKKKRVPLLMSVPRGQPINTPAKNALISKFLKKSAEDNVNKKKCEPPNGVIEII